MRWRTQDLLSRCDDEPLAARTRAGLSIDPETRRELARLRGLRRTMRSLPTLDLPAEGWARIERTLAHPPSRRAPPPRYIGFAAALALAALATILVSRPREPAADPAAQVTAAQPLPPPRVRQDAPLAGTRRASRALELEGSALQAESARLEHVLMQLPRARSVTDVSTASTIVGLEDQIAWIDTLMSESAAAGSRPELRHALLRERVAVMSALVDVRYLQMPEPIY